MKKVKVLFLFILFITYFSTTVLAAEESQIITAIEIEGNSHVSDRNLRSLIKARIGQPAEKAILTNDRQRIYDSGYFRDVNILFEYYNGGIKIIYQVEELPIIKKIVLDGNVSYTDQELITILNITEGKILNYNKLEKGTEKIIETYQNDGYILASFRGLDITDDGILKLKINEGYINDIIIKGTKKTKDYIITRELEFVKDDIFNVNVLKKSFQRVYNLNFFKELDPTFEKVEDKENHYNIIVEVVEDKTRSYNFGVTHNSNDGWIGNIDINARNFLGNGQTLGFNWEFGGVRNYSLYFYEPWLMNEELSFSMNVYDKTSEEKDSKNKKYIKNRIGGNVSFGHKLIDDWNGLMKFKIENSTIDWKDRTDSEENIPDTEKASVRSLTLRTSRDTTDNLFHPTSGARDLLSIEYAGQMLGGDHNFVKYDVDLKRYYPGFARGHSWALRMDTGIALGDVPLLEKYKLGGSSTLRGYEFGSFIGEKMLVLKAEYRIPVVDKITGVVFTDAGNAWKINQAPDLKDLHFSYGAGIRFDSPIGQVRIDYGINENGVGETYFGIGQSF
ncbi:MAG: BamA/OMP85 family outer membrane protein [Halanaerobiaceae bacterium]